ncbi:hypothetical protein PtA15_6A317 [Puccinia triticina]|uniref:Uncharacterized protein n=1 Tax=Puccinia triticina TaxID=208348 RepID=A0ABY7CLZ8_9BASI|nr:uncharacterized protein PtA15_6A317 [Puccinia triticina]WAQ85689.1 hypothetical protein PtA15_6A317 [Puccinia triticina]
MDIPETQDLTFMDSSETLSSASPGDPKGSANLINDVQKLLTDAEEIVSKVKPTIELKDADQKQGPNKLKQDFTKMVRPMTEKPLVPEHISEMVEAPLKRI